MSPLRHFLSPLLLGLAAVAGAVTPEDAAAYKSEIRPLLSALCIECHKEGKQADFLAVKDLSQIHDERGNLRSAVAQRCRSPWRGRGSRAKASSIEYTSSSAT